MEFDKQTILMDQAADRAAEQAEAGEAFAAMHNSNIIETSFDTLMRALDALAAIKFEPLAPEPQSFSPEALRFAYSVLCQPQTAHLSVTEQVRIKYAVCQAWDNAHPPAPVVEPPPERKPGVKPAISGLHVMAGMR